MHKNYRYPNPVKTRTLDIVFYYQRKKPHDVIYNKNLCVDFGLSRSDASGRLSKLRQWGLFKYNEGGRGYNGYVLTDRGRKFKDFSKEDLK